MADVTSSRQDLFDWLQSKWTADSQKLGGGVVNLGARAFVRDNVPYDNLPEPFIRVGITCRVGSSQGVRRETCTVTFIIQGVRNNDPLELDTILHQLRVTFDDLTPTATSGWSFSTFVYDGQPHQGPPVGPDNTVHTYGTCIARRN